MKKYALIFSLIFPYQAMACSVPPMEQHVSDLELIVKVLSKLFALMAIHKQEINGFNMLSNRSALTSQSNRTNKSLEALICRRFGEKVRESLKITC